MCSCGSCLYYRLKKERCTGGLKGYCTRAKLKISARGYLEDGMFRYAEVPNNGLCDDYKRDWSKDEQGKEKDGNHWQRQ